ncbi:MAG TPA: hypothetical protein VHO25_18260, partial [Polyangiaceae bacterium]|nr:hypothetical protein [Polyangiaceae bacterium]
YFGTLDPVGSTGEDCGVDLRALRLLPSTGDALDLLGTLNPENDVYSWLVVRPADRGQRLAPNTEYAVQLRLADPEGDACVCNDSPNSVEWTTISKFTTGATADIDGPDFAGLEGLVGGLRSESSSNCGSTQGTQIIADHAGATDASPELRYDIIVNDVLASRYVKEVTPSLGFPQIFCGTAPLSNWTFVSPGDRIEVRAVDLAGNESPPHEPLVVDQRMCNGDAPSEAEPEPQTDPPDLPAVDTTADGTGTPTEMGTGNSSTSGPTQVPVSNSQNASGCTISGSLSRSTDNVRRWGVGPLIGVLLLLRRRR